MKNFLLLTLLSLIITNCDKESNDTGTFGFIGGEIVNPNNRYVVLSEGEHILDTVLLNSQNRFLYKIEDLRPGIFTFRHNPEEQIVLLEEGDSLHFRLNTMEFDESLVFTGRGAKKNNYLIDLYLQNEVERENMLQHCQLPPEVFASKMDSMTSVKHEKLKTFERKNSTSELFNEIADANIFYHNYANMEIYPFAYYGNNELKNLKSLPDSFYSYRKDADLNNDNLSSYFPYYRFLNSHFNNIALTKHFKHSNDSIFKRHSLDYNLDRLQVIDSLIDHESIKNTHLRQTAIRFIFGTKKAEDIKVLVSDYLRKSTNEGHKKYVQSIARSFLRLAAGKQIPDVDLINSQGEHISLLSTIKKPSVIYFWTYSRRSQFKDSHLKTKTLKENYPDLDFIAINASHTTNKNWQAALKQYGFSLHNEYRLADVKKARHDLVISSVSKVMLINEDGTILDAYANMSDPLFEEQLLGLLNQ